MRVARIINICLLIVLSSSYGLQQANAVSAMGAASEMRSKLLKDLRYLQIMVSNFGEQNLSNEEKDLIFGQYYPEYENNFNNESEYNAYIANEQERHDYNFIKAYENCKNLFNMASISLFQKSYVKSKMQFMELKWRIIRLYKAMSFLYIKRAKDMLDKAFYKSVDKLIEYGKENAKVRKFSIVYDPLQDALLYNPKDYYFVFAKVKLDSYLKGGYRSLQNAKEIFGYDFRIVYRDKEGKIIPERESEQDTLHYEEYLNRFEYNFEREWMQLIANARQAKLYALEIFKIHNKYRYNDILTKYSMVHRKVTGIYDDRIPDQFMVDYIDSLKLVLQDEINMFRQHLTFHNIDASKYVVEINGKMVKVSGNEDVFDDPAPLDEFNKKAIAEPESAPEGENVPSEAEPVPESQ